MNQPVFIDTLINELDDRRAMGLNLDYEPMRFEHTDSITDRLRHFTRSELAEKVEQPSVALVDRYAAGNLLSLIGDPRIQPFTPQMIEIPGGRTWLGLGAGSLEEVVRKYADLGVLRDWIEKEVPRYEAQIKPFRIGKYPVTNFEYQQFLSAQSQYEIPSSWPFGRYPAQCANHPVYTISYEAAHAYTKWLSHKTHRRYRLPSELEWEYAAAGPYQHVFPWGNCYLDDHANTAEFGLYSTTPVGMFVEGASCFGVLDMAGNVEEYTSSDYWVYPGGRFVADDLTKRAKTYKIARGGSFTRFRDLARCKRRHGRYAKAIYVMGFRLAQTTD